MNVNLEELVLKAAESDNKVDLDNVLKYFETTNMTDTAGNYLSLILDQWSKTPEKHPNKTLFIIEVAKFFKKTEEDLELRNALVIAIKNLLPSTVNKATAVKILGLRSKEIPLSKVYDRYSFLNKLQSGQIYYNNLTKTWGITGKIDWMVETISLFNFNGLFIQDIELESFFDHSFLFNNVDAIINLQKIKSEPIKSEFVAILKENALTVLDDHRLRTIILESLVPNVFSFEKFNLWYQDGDAVSSQNQANTNPKNARSIQELHSILLDKQVSGETFTQEIKQRISHVLNLLKPASGLNEYLLWAECICMIIPHYSIEEISLLAPVNKQIQTIVWPETIEESNDICFGIWTKLKALSLSNWIKYTENIKGSEYLKRILSFLPWKIWPILTSKLSTTLVESIIEETNKITNPEMLLWLWKNKTKISQESLDKLNYTVLIPAIYKARTGALWKIAPKELKDLLLENFEFQRLVLRDETERGVITFLEFLNNTPALTVNDRQTLIVKLSRSSNAIKTILQSGQAQVIVSCKHVEDSTKNETFITSFKSYNEKIAELQDILNRQIPENTEAIATARAHGDLRENAEFAAAKERQKFLTQYRALLESKIAATRPTDFSEIQIKDTVIAGTTITVEYEDKTIEILHILGAWDSDPTKKFISYETELGQAIIGRKIHDSISLPGNKTCKILKIEPLPKEILNELKT